MCGSPPEPLTRTHVAQVSARGLANWKGERAEDFSASKTKAPLTITAKYVSWETSEKVDIAKLLLESESNVTAWFVFTVGQPQDRGLNTKGKAGSSAQRKLDFTYQQPREWWVPSAEHSCMSEIAHAALLMELVELTRVGFALHPSTFSSLQALYCIQLLILQY